MSNYKNYYRVITTTANDGTITINKIQINVDAWSQMGSSTSTDTYTTQAGETVTIAITRERQTYYDYEQEQNESKRDIKLLKKEFISEVEKEFKKVLSL
jgi:hypothetical protein